MIKYSLLIIFFFSCLFLAHGQLENHLDNIMITSKKKKTQVKADKNGKLHVNVSPKDVLYFKAMGGVSYSNFGAVGDGKTDDMDAIAATHAFANLHALRVKADEGFTYYIGGKERTAEIRTDTDFGTAAFIIDDTEVQNHRASVFLVASQQRPFKVNGITSLKRNQEKIDLSLPRSCLISVVNSNVKHYIRYGLNQDNGSQQTDIFVVDKNGNVDLDAPIIWDFDQITDMTAIPLDTTTLYISGGRFTTIANKAESKYNYYSRNIAITRSNVVVDGLEHHVIGEGDHGAPYGGFINIRDCAYVRVKNTLLTGRKTYRTIGSAGKPVSMGSYDLLVNRALNVTLENCRQTNDINDSTYWGVMSSNYSKNLIYDHCTFSRFDAHKGVANATILNSTLGHMGINAIGSGVLTVENSTIRGKTLINLRGDYGSSWQGEIVIRNCIFVPEGGKTSSANIIGGAYSGQHNFGYTCYMPETITIENLHIDDTHHPEDYKGPAIFKDFNEEMTDDTYIEEFPYIRTNEIILKNVTTASGKNLIISRNPFMFKDVKVNTY
ncbi:MULTISPECIES: hypothetical protein [unclassified Arenibacter]|uniref:hypothetical protein n=1 Tax=unclassified Arenibacter TaxID=2615047 RepID=UPI000E35255F|nr:MULTISPECIES: hypothetical protein [unclassified Arenibacter]MCM4162422.1 hypothetical protein [Arenibacter sp. A80]RFT58016.1 hypothetical protein D0S24_02315 [Arenibacter sp. P308M17]